LGANATQIFSDLGATELPNSASAGMPGLFLPAALLENARDCSQRKTNNALNKSSFAWHPRCGSRSNELPPPRGRSLANMTRRSLEQQHRARGLNYQFHWSDYRFRKSSGAIFAAIRRASSQRRE
jgi:hypothetical protein